MQSNSQTDRPWSSWHGWDRHETDRFGRRRVRLSLQDLADLRDLRSLKIDWRQSRPEITVYTPNQIRHFIRLDHSLTGRAGAQPLPYPTIPASWIRGLPRDLQENGGPWRMPELRQFAVSRPQPTLSPSSQSGWWDAAAKTLPVGAVLLALLLLLARGAEKCIEKRFFLLKRRRSEEWPTPNVLATNLQNNRDQDPPPLDDVFPSDPIRPADLPPPYSECTQPRQNEEPPPPYSSCYVTYSNPKDGIPSVHFYNSQRQRLFGPSTSNADQSTAIIDTGQPGPSNTAANPGCEENEANRISERNLNNEVQIPIDGVPRNGSNTVVNDRVVQVNVMDSMPERNVLVA